MDIYCYIVGKGIDRVERALQFANNNGSPQNDKISVIICPIAKNEILFICIKIINKSDNCKIPVKLLIFNYGTLKMSNGKCHFVFWSPNKKKI